MTSPIDTIREALEFAPIGNGAALAALTEVEHQLAAADERYELMAGEARKLNRACLAAERRANELADALREMAYRTAIDGRLCWCSDTYRAHNPDGPHGVRCSVARAALDRQEQT